MSSPFWDACIARFLSAQRLEYLRLEQVSQDAYTYGRADIRKRALHVVVDVGGGVTAVPTLTLSDVHQLRPRSPVSRR